VQEVTALDVAAEALNLTVLHYDAEGKELVGDPTFDQCRPRGCPNDSISRKAARGLEVSDRSLRAGAEAAVGCRRKAQQSQSLLNEQHDVAAVASPRGVVEGGYPAGKCRRSGGGSR